jgi:hypothetical protein
MSLQTINEANIRKITNKAMLLHLFIGIGEQINVFMNAHKDIYQHELFF